MDIKKLQVLENLLHEYFSELEELSVDNYFNTIETIAISDCIDNNKLQGGSQEILNALEREAYKLAQTEKELKQQYLILTQLGDIKSLIEDINKLWW